MNIWVVEFEIVATVYVIGGSGGWGVESEVSTAQPREREGSPEPSDADCQREGGRCNAH